MIHKKSKKYYYLRGLSIKRKQSRFRRIRTAQNKKRRFKSSIPVNYNKKVKYIDKTVKKKILAGTSFSLLDDPLNIVRIINSIEKCKNLSTSKISIEIDLTRITKIDSGAICLLLAKVNEVSVHDKIKIFGTFPIDEDCKKTFIESGASEYMRDMHGKKFEKRGDNLIIKIGSNKTDNEIVGKTIKKAMKFITDEEVHFPPVFSIVQEMCSNSVEHSNDNIPNWMFGVVFEIDNKTKEKWVTFTMTDVGFGILKTLKRKFHIQIQEQLTLKSDVEVLYSAFQKKYGSKTEDINRNKGLPLILNRVKKQYVGDMKVITNNVILHLGNYERSSILQKSLPGTFYSWKVDKTNIESWKQKTIS